MGIGRAIVEQLAGDGATVVFGDIIADNVRDLGTSLRDKGLAVEGRASDVAKQGRDRIADRQALVASNGRLDIMVNCAGINRDTMLHKMTDEQWDEVLAVDLTGAFYGTRKALAGHARSRPGGGSIVGISSLVVARQPRTGELRLGQGGPGRPHVDDGPGRRPLPGEGERDLPWLHRDRHDAGIVPGDVGRRRGPDTAWSCR